MCQLGAGLIVAAFLLVAIIERSRKRGRRFHKRHRVFPKLHQPAALSPVGIARWRRRSENRASSPSRGPRFRRSVVAGADVHRHSQNAADEHGSLKQLRAAVYPDRRLDLAEGKDHLNHCNQSGHRLYRHPPHPQTRPKPSAQSRRSCGDSRRSLLGYRAGHGRIDSPAPSRHTASCSTTFSRPRS